jgi:predicted ATP-dependent Lon-type protease
MRMERYVGGDSSREIIKDKLRRNFDGKIVRKDLTKKIKEDANVSIALGKPAISTLAVLGDISISGTMIKVDELANAMQVCLDSGAKKLLLPISSAADLGSVPSELVGCFNLIFYQSAEDAVFKALGVE